MLSIIKGPYLQWPRPDSMTVMWEISSPADAQVYYYETEPVSHGFNGKSRTLEETATVVKGTAEGYIHRVTLSGLTTDTTYHYKVTSTNPAGEHVASELHPFKTAVATQTPFPFAVTSETGGYGDDQINRRLFPLIERYRPDFLLMVGDAVRNGLQYDDWQEFFFAPARDLLHHTPFYLCLGNHEENSPMFYQFVSFPEPKNYYAFDYGNTHFTALDCTAMIDGDTAEMGPESPQWKFLVDDLQNAQATWKIVFFHYPPYVSSDYQVEQMRALCPILEEYDVNLVFNSHSIVYERSHPIRAGAFAPQGGIVYVVAGGAGAKPEWFHPKRAWHTAQALAVPHFVQVVVAGQTLELRAIDQDGRLFDTFLLSKD
jgi:hypothetical protein